MDTSLLFVVIVALTAFVAILFIGAQTYSLVKFVRDMMIKLCEDSKNHNIEE